MEGHIPFKRSSEDKISNPATEEKRSSFRVKIDSPVILKTDSFRINQTKVYKGWSVNLSEGGLGLSLDSKVELLSPLFLEFSLLNLPLRLRGEVMWGKILDNGRYYCGARFLNKEKFHDSILKRFLFTNDEYILQLIKNLPELERGLSEKIEYFFRSDVKGFIENLIKLERMIKDKNIPENYILNELTNASSELLKKGGELEEAIKDKALMKKIKLDFRSLVDYWVCKSNIIRLSLKESYGYSGNYVVLETIYDNIPISGGLGFYYDKSFLNTPYVVAVRNRKEKMKGFLTAFLQKSGLSLVNILNLGSGPCREIIELLPHIDIKKRLRFTCVDFDENAINFAKDRLRLLPENIEVEFIRENILNMIQFKGQTLIADKQDLIYSIGLTDYLTDEVLKRVISFCLSRLSPKGMFIIAHKDRDKNIALAPDWFCDWVFQPRDIDSLIKLVNDAGIKDLTIDVDWEESKKIFFLILTRRR